MVRLAPRAAASGHQREVIVHAFAAVGLDVQWFGLDGDLSATTATGNVAKPNLTIRLAIEATDQRRADGGLARIIAAALHEIRAQLPSLPLGIEIAVPDGLRRLSFAPSDEPEDVAAGALGIDSALALGVPVVGWHARDRRWIVL